MKRIEALEDLIIGPFLSFSFSSSFFFFFLSPGKKQTFRPPVVQYMHRTTRERKQQQPLSSRRTNSWYISSKQKLLQPQNSSTLFQSASSLKYPYTSPQQKRLKHSTPVKRVTRRRTYSRPDSPHETNQHRQKSQAWEEVLCRGL